MISRSLPLGHIKFLPGQETMVGIELWGGGSLTINKRAELCSERSSQMRLELLSRAGRYMPSKE